MPQTTISAASPKGRRIPTHPGEFFLEEVRPNIDMSLAQIAAALGVSRSYFDLVIKAKTPVTAEMAVRLGRLCGNGPHLWMQMQVNHDIAKAEAELAEEVKRIRVLPIARLDTKRGRVTRRSKRVS